MKKLNVLKNKFAKERLSAKETIQLKGGDDKRKPIGGGTGGGGQLPIGGGGGVPNGLNSYSLRANVNDLRT